MTSLVERAPADFLVDVANQVNIEAEQRVLNYLVQCRGWTVVDRRAARLRWDFEVHLPDGGMTRLDVKADSYIDQSARVPFEREHVYRDGSQKAGWGMDPALDVVAVVGTTSWRGVFVRVKELREMVLRADYEPVMRRSWVPINRENARGGYVTRGWAVPIEDGWQDGAIWHIASLPTGLW